jgi:hypothetical protein
MKSSYRHAFILVSFRLFNKNVRTKAPGGSPGGGENDAGQ